MKKIYSHSVITATVLFCAIAMKALAQENPCQLSVTTDPTDAIVSCDGKNETVSPLILSNMKPGKYLLVATKQGFKETRRTIELTPGQKMALEMKLEPVLGLVLIHSSPADSEVKINGAYRGKTPLLVTGLPIGEYRVNISSFGYETKEVDLSIKDRTPKKINLKLSSDSAILSLNSDPSGANITFNGISKGITPCVLERIQPGDNTLKITMKGHVPYEKKLKLAADKKEELTVKLEPIPAKLTVVSTPAKARIYLDNEFKGESPVTLTLKPGSYRLRAGLEAHIPMARDITLELAQETSEEFRLERNCGMIELTTTPPGVTVVIDGKKVGVTAAPQDNASDKSKSQPLKIDRLLVGLHLISLQKAGFAAKEFKIKMKKNDALAMNHKMERLFTPDHEVRTPAGIFQGVLIKTKANGDLELEIAPGIVRKIRKEHVLSQRKLTETETKNNQ
ncbi:PEGA domain-containing protein [Verrucomicrobiota bacterium]